MKKGFLFGVTLLFLALGFSDSLIAQGSSTISGRIEDVTKGVLPGVTITVTNAETGATETAVSSENGDYEIGGLAAGDYDINAEMSGFRTHRERVTVQAGENKRIDIMLELSGFIDEVTVTATRREQSIQDVGVSIMAFDRFLLKDFDIVNSADIVKFTPNLVFATTAGEGQKMNVVMRGVGLNTSSETIESNVGLYFDDVYIASTSGFSFGLFDMERIEVLRGPQGTLFGNTVTGGLIHHISRKPVLGEVDGYANMRYGSFDQVRLEAAAGGPLSDKVAVRVAGMFDRHDGWFENTFVPTDPAVKVDDNNKANAAGLRAQLLWQPSDNFDMLFRARWSQNDPSTGSTFKPLVGYIPTEGPDAGLGIALPPDVDNNFGSCTGCDRAGNPNSIGDGDIRSGSRNRFGNLNVAHQGGGMLLNWGIGSMTLTSVTDYDALTKNFAEDSDGGPKQSVGQFTDTDAKQFQQEVRLAGASEKLNWTVGAFYLYRDVFVDFAVDFRNSDFAGPPWLQITRTDQQSSNTAIFGRIEWELSDKWTLIPGLRWYREEVDFKNWRDLFFTSGLERRDREVEAKEPFSNVSGKLELQYRPNDNGMIYGYFARGIRPGAFNQVVPEGAERLLLEEKLHAFEGGLKYDLPNAPVRINAAGYYYDYQDMQTRAFLGFESFQLNVDSKIYGGEIDFTARPVDTLLLYLSTGFLHGRVQDLENGATGEVRDTKQPNAPEFTLSGQVKYTWLLSGADSVFASLNASYRSETFSEVENNPVQLVPSYTLVGARLGYTASSGWEVGIQADNLLDEDYFTFMGFVTSINTVQRFVGRPRWVGVYFNYNFGR